MKCADESSIPTVDGAKAMFAAADEAQANREWCGTESVSTSPATAILDLAERVKGQRPREPLTITEALVSLRESLERSGMPLGALSDLEDAIRHLQAKPDPTAAIVRFLRAEEERFDRGSEDADLGVEGRERCRNKASALRTVAAYIERGDHLTADTASGETEHERGRQEGRREAIEEAVAMLRAEHAVGSIGTLDFVARLLEKYEANRGKGQHAESEPETALRAMLRAYEAAALEAETVALSRNPVLGQDPEWHRLHRICGRTIESVNEIRSALSRLRARQVAPRLSTRLAGDYEARLAGTRPLDAPPAE